MQAEGTFAIKIEVEQVSRTQLLAALEDRESYSWFEFVVVLCKRSWQCIRIVK